MAANISDQPIECLEPAEPTKSRSRLPTAFRSLANRNFRYLWLGQFASATAMHADMVARVILVWELTDALATNVKRQRQGWTTICADL